MATDYRQQLTHLIEQAYQYEFTAWLSLFEQLTSDYELNIIAAPALSFPAADIAYAVCDENRSVLALNFLGLLGVDSALPHFFLDYANSHEKKQRALNDFIQPISKRLYQLLYNAWRKYRPLCELTRGVKRDHTIAHHDNVIDVDKIQSSYLQYCQALSAGFDRGDTIFNTRLFGRGRRNSQGLVQLLSHVLHRIKIRIKQFVPCWLNLACHDTLGSENHSLGHNSFLGDRTYDITSGIAIYLGPIDIKQVLSLYHNKPLIQLLTQLIDYYLDAGIDYQLLCSMKVSSETLTSHQMVLGISTFIGDACSCLYQVRLV